MSTILTSIIDQKQHEVSRLHDRIGSSFELALTSLLIKKNDFKFKKALQQSGLNIIAEIKRCSPSKGKLAEIPDVTALADQYYQGGAAAISVLTDQDFFGGSVNDLRQVSHQLSNTPCAVLRKEFIIDRMQLIETALAGADAVLLIASVLKDELGSFIVDAKKLGLDALVEIHVESELPLAIEAGAEIIGINNRNLNTFEVDPEHAIKLMREIPDHILKVSESGILQPLQAKQAFDIGFNAVLIGEALVKSLQPEHFIAEIKKLCQC